MLKSLFSCKKVGGLTFIRVGRLSVSFCLTAKAVDKSARKTVRKEVRKTVRLPRANWPVSIPTLAVETDAQRRWKAAIARLEADIAALAH